MRAALLLALALAACRPPPPPLVHPRPVARAAPAAVEPARAVDAPLRAAVIARPGPAAIAVIALPHRAPPALAAVLARQVLRAEALAPHRAAGVVLAAEVDGPTLRLTVAAPAAALPEALAAALRALAAPPLDDEALAEALWPTRAEPARPRPEAVRAAAAALPDRALAAVVIVGELDEHALRAALTDGTAAWAGAAPPPLPAPMPAALAADPDAAADAWLARQLEAAP